MFDSGMGGLTVLRALARRLPYAHYRYLGDTARLPYGTKSPATVRRYAERAAEALTRTPLDALVVACNTASAYALPALKSQLHPLPVFGVIEPGAERVATSASGVGRDPVVLVLATEATVREGAYERALLARLPGARVFARPAPLLVALAESGDSSRPIADAILADALTIAPGASLTHVLLGCTHFPLFAAAIESFAGSLLPLDVRVVDSAATTADAVARALSGSDSASAPTASGSPSFEFLVTDDPQRFTRLGERFLGRLPAAVALVDL
ncbi:MAG: glutamate racemase [Pseudomonadota bacterium]